jgi:DEAD/DEAH box helicase/Helicase conserved C-terminal domain
MIDERQLLDDPRVIESIGRVHTLLAGREFPALVLDPGESSPDWSELLGWASLLGQLAAERSLDAALRIVQGCILMSDDGRARELAASLLELQGNGRAVSLAKQRGLVDAGLEVRTANRLTMSRVRRRLELQIPMRSGEVIEGNPFQREFWTLMDDRRVVSVSAATSAGKSHIVRQYILEKIFDTSSFFAVYVAPTRALVEEVADSFRNAVDENVVGVYTFPWDPELGTRDREILVVTQERLQVLLGIGHRSVDFLFVDEAHKFGDRYRGLVLRHVVEVVFRNYPQSRIVLASPLVTDPRAMLPLTLRAESATLVSEAITVNQNLIWVNQVPRQPTRWAAELIEGERSYGLGRVQLANSPTQVSKRLPFVAAALGQDSHGNLIYVNGAADAEKTARQLADVLGEATEISNELSQLSDLSSELVHPRYLLSTVVKSGVGFHYGNMPQLLRSAVEELFRSGHLRYLVCTSTLVEGVNLGCRSIFMRGPKKGLGTPMSESDFWNLAGRAGRWGREFQGNVVCVDTNDASTWPEPPPRKRGRYAVANALNEPLRDVGKFLAFLRNSTDVSKSEARYFEYVESYLSLELAQQRSIDSTLLEVVGQANERLEISVLLQSNIENADVPVVLLANNLGVSPRSIRQLYERFSVFQDPVSLVLAPPESYDALDSFNRALTILGESVTLEFGSEARRFMLSRLMVNWMRGWSLRRIIDDRIAFLNSRSREYKLPSLIRECMADVEEFARFLGPKYLSCYVDVLRWYLSVIGRLDLIQMLPNIGMLLELGVSSQTQLSLLALGLSRSTSVALAEVFASNELTRIECVDRLRGLDLAGSELSNSAQSEVVKLLTRLDGSSNASG